MPTNRNDNSAARGFGAGYAIVAAGFQLAFSILFFLGMGYLVDGWLGSRPVMTLIGAFIGLGAGLYAFVLRVQAQSRAGRGPERGERS